MAAITLHASDEGERLLRDHFVRHIGIAKARNAGFVLEKRIMARQAWIHPVAITLNRKSIALLVALRAEHEMPQSPMPISVRRPIT